MNFEEIEQELIAAASEVYGSMQKEFDKYRLEGNPEIYNKHFGYANSDGELGPNFSPWLTAPIKYVRYPQKHIQSNYVFIENLGALEGKKLFEIGVGPGYTFTLLEKHLSAEMLGVDINIETQRVYSAMRAKLGIDKKVFEFRVEKYKPIPIPKNTEAVLAFATVFHRSWTVDEHRWFIEDVASKLVGEKLLVLRFNSRGFRDNQPVYEFYSDSSEQPIADDPNFRLMRL